MVFGGEQSKLVREYPRWSEMCLLGFIQSLSLGLEYRLPAEEKQEQIQNETPVASTLKHHCWVAKLGW